MPYQDNADQTNFWADFIASSKTLGTQAEQLVATGTPHQIKVSTPEQKCIGWPEQKCITWPEATEEVLSGMDGGLLGRAERSSPIAASRRAVGAGLDGERAHRAIMVAPRCALLLP